MSKQDRRSRRPQRRRELGLLALLLVPLLLILHAPLLAAIVPGALLTVASIDALHHRERHALPSAAVVDLQDAHERDRIANATAIDARTRRVDGSHQRQ